MQDNKKSKQSSGRVQYKLLLGRRHRNDSFGDSGCCRTRPLATSKWKPSEGADKASLLTLRELLSWPSGKQEQQGKLAISRCANGQDTGPASASAFESS